MCRPQGDRFGGALDAAAKMFSKAFDSGIIPMEFVNKMKKEGKLIMGIGHRVKSVRLALAQTGEALTGGWGREKTAKRISSCWRQLLAKLLNHQAV